MKSSERARFTRFSWIPALLFALVLSACATHGNTVPASNTHIAPKYPTATRQPSPGQLLPNRPITYVALGASDAVGIGSDRPGSQGYVPLVVAHLPRGSHLINLGISGIELHGALSQELPLAISTSPDLITIWLVANDFIGGVTYNDYMSDLNTLLAQLHTKTHARIVMADLPDLTRLPAFADQTSTQKAHTQQVIQRWNAGISQAADRYGVVLVDLYSKGSQLTAHPEYISADGFHPSPAGYVQLANLFWQAIEG